MIRLMMALRRAGRAGPRKKRLNVPDPFGGHERAQIFFFSFDGEILWTKEVGEFVHST